MNKVGNILLTAGLVALYLALTSAKKDGDQIANTDQNMGTNGKLPRGYRNNNPLNIRISTDNWQGKVPNEQNTDKVFEQFTSMPYGYRAAFKLLANYVYKHGCDTLAKIISRWAPANENNTSGYINRVCSTTGYQPDTYINPENQTQMEALVYAMSLVENGTKVLPNTSAIREGWALYI